MQGLQAPKYLHPELHTFANNVGPYEAGRCWSFSAQTARYARHVSGMHAAHGHAWARIAALAMETVRAMDDFDD
jgi:hypothetical protein